MVFFLWIFRETRKRKTQVSPCQREDMTLAPGSYLLCPGVGDADPSGHSQLFIHHYIQLKFHRPQV